MTGCFDVYVLIWDSLAMATFDAAATALLQSVQQAAQSAAQAAQARTSCKQLQ